MTEPYVHSVAGQRTVSHDTGQQTAWIIYDTCAISDGEVDRVLRQALPWWPFNNHRRVRFYDRTPTSVSHHVWTTVHGTPVCFRIIVSNNYSFGMSIEQLDALLLSVVRQLRVRLRQRR